MAKTRNRFMVTVSYSFKEYDHEVDQFVIESFHLCGITPLGTGTDFVSRDLGGYADSEIKCLNLMDYLHACPALSFRISYYLTENEP